MTYVFGALAGAVWGFLAALLNAFVTKKCIAKRLDMSEEFMEQKIAFFKQQGCTLFS